MSFSFMMSECEDGDQDVDDHEVQPNLHRRSAHWVRLGTTMLSTNTMESADSQSIEKEQENG